MKSLVVYYTRTGVTKFVAQTIAAELGSDIEEVVDLKNRAGKLGWMSAGRDSMQGKETQIAPTTKNGGKRVVCQPGITEEAKSVETIECTETTSTAAIPPRTKPAAS